MLNKIKEYINKYLMNDTNSKNIVIKHPSEFNRGDVLPNFYSDNCGYCGIHIKEKGVYLFIVNELPFITLKVGKQQLMHPNCAIKFMDETMITLAKMFNHINKIQENFIEKYDDMIIISELKDEKE